MRPIRAWVADITAIWTTQGWLYLAVVLDIYSRLVVGWAMDAHRDEALVEQAARMALAHRQSQPGLTPITRIAAVSIPPPTTASCSTRTASS